MLLSLLKRTLLGKPEQQAEDLLKGVPVFIL